MKKKIFLIVTSILIFIACASKNKYNNLKEQSLKDREMKAELLQYSQNGGTGISKITLINDADTFSILWGERNKTKIPQPKAREVDFNKNSVILIDFYKSNYGIPAKKLNSVDFKRDTCFINLNVPQIDFKGYVTMVVVKDYMFILTEKLKDNTPLKLKIENKK